MAGSENRVQFNLKNVHYALMTGEGSVPAWETPTPIPGAVTLTLDPQGETTPFYADGIIYYQTIANNGYSGDLEMARFPDQMMKEVWGFEEVEGDAVLIERSNAEPKAFALLYQIDGDVDHQYYCLYNCTGARPGIGSATTGETKEPQTQISTISAVPLENNDVFVRTTAKTPDAVKAAWFQKVYQRPEAGAGEE